MATSEVEVGGEIVAGRILPALVVAPEDGDRGWTPQIIGASFSLPGGLRIALASPPSSPRLGRGPRPTWKPQAWVAAPPHAGLRNTVRRGHPTQKAGRKAMEKDSGELWGQRAGGVRMLPVLCGSPHAPCTLFPLGIVSLSPSSSPSHLQLYFSR